MPLLTFLRPPRPRRRRYHLNGCDINMEHFLTDVRGYGERGAGTRHNPSPKTDTCKADARREQALQSLAPLKSSTKPACANNLLPYHLIHWGQMGVTMHLDHTHGPEDHQTTHHHRSHTTTGGRCGEEVKQGMK